MEINGRINDIILSSTTSKERMFPILNKELKDSVSMGGRNVQVAEEILKSNGIMTIAKEVGGNHGRSLKFHLDTGIVTVEKKS